MLDVTKMMAIFTFIGGMIMSILLFLCLPIASGVILGLAGFATTIGVTAWVLRFCIGDNDEEH